MGGILPKKSTEAQAREDFITQLSFELCVPVHEIDAWPEHTIKRYEDYAARHMLPTAVAHLYWAQIPFVAAKIAGGGDKLSLSDFAMRLNPVAQTAEMEDAANDAVWEKLRSRSRRRS